MLRVHLRDARLTRRSGRRPLWTPHSAAHVQFPDVRHFRRNSAPLPRRRSRGRRGRHSETLPKPRPGYWRPRFLRLKEKLRTERLRRSARRRRGRAQAHLAARGFGALRLQRLQEQRRAHPRGRARGLGLRGREPLLDDARAQLGV